MIKTTFLQLTAALIFFSGVVHADEIQASPQKCKGVGAADAAPGDAQIDTAFSPDGGSKNLVLKVIRSARKTIRLAGYSFTSPTIVRALIDAKCRGVDVAVVVDYTNNVVDDRSGKARVALNSLVSAGISTRTIARYPIHHDKFIVADDLHVETGSFNYSDSAIWRNSENVLVVWNNPQVAASYLKHWQSRYDNGLQITDNR